MATVKAEELAIEVGAEDVYLGNNDDNTETFIQVPYGY